MLTFLLPFTLSFPHFFTYVGIKREDGKERERERKKENCTFRVYVFEGVALKRRSTLPANKYTYYTFIQAYSRSQN
jgi:hypothetical protein